MKEILYRAKAINRNPNINYRTNYQNGDWVYGLVSRLDEYSAEMTNTDGVSGIDVDRKTICEYTGLIDKNGNKIFEGDIIKNHYAIGVVAFGEFRFSACDEYACTHYGVYAKSNYRNFYHDDGYALLPSENDRFELIGNIYNNPELLEK